jgi:hypothetical protein
LAGRNALRIHGFKALAGGTGVRANAHDLRAIGTGLEAGAEVLADRDQGFVELLLNARLNRKNGSGERGVRAKEGREIHR